MDNTLLELGQKPLETEDAAERTEIFEGPEHSVSKMEGHKES